MSEDNKAQFAPQLYIPGGVTDISFYATAFGAIELMRLNNDNGTVHVAELSIDGALFHIHEDKVLAGKFSPSKVNGTTAAIGLFVENVDAVVAKALACGATMLSPPQSYDYGYRQSEIRDPFGHIWLIEMKILNSDIE